MSGGLRCSVKGKSAVVAFLWELLHPGQLWDHLRAREQVKALEVLQERTLFSFV